MPTPENPNIDSNNLFTEIVAGNVPASFVYRDDRVSAFMDIQPVNPGHVLVIPNECAANLSELDEETGAHLFRVGHRIAKAIRQSDLKCEGVNIFLADGEAAGQEVFHVHLHVFPRFHEDGFGLTHSDDYTNLPERPELDDAAEKIKGALREI